MEDVMRVGPGVCPAAASVIQGEAAGKRQCCRVTPWPTPDWCAQCMTDLKIRGCFGDTQGALGIPAPTPKEGAEWPADGLASSE